MFILSNLSFLMIYIGKREPSSIVRCMYIKAFLSIHPGSHMPRMLNLPRFKVLILVRRVHRSRRTTYTWRPGTCIKFHMAATAYRSLDVPHQHFRSETNDKHILTYTDRACSNNGGDNRLCILLSTSWGKGIR